MKLIRNLVFPWIMFFLLVTSAIVLAGVRFTRVQLTAPQLNFTLGVGAFLCLLININSLGTVGIWMSEALPESLRYGTWRWVLRAIKAVLACAAFWFVGRLPWIPLVWQAAVIPGVFTIGLFVVVFSLLGPILKFSSNMAWNRAFSILLSLPIFLAVPITSLFVSQTMITAYLSSRPDLAPDFDGRNRQDQFLSVLKGGVTSSARTPGGKDSGASKQILGKSAPIPEKGPTATKIDKRALALSELAQNSRGSCSEHDREIVASLDSKIDDVVYWAIKSLRCSDVKSVVGLTKLARIMIEYPAAKVRAAAIQAMSKYGSENIRQISYLLYKRINPHESAEVIEAATSALNALGPEETRIAAKRLKALLDAPDGASYAAAKTLIDVEGRDDLIAEYIGQHLNGDKDARLRAIGMICLLPQAKRSIAEEHIGNLVEIVHSIDENDPGLRALSCLGHAGFLAIRAELKSPQILDRPSAAHALYELNVKDAPEALETADTCSRDSNPQVRNWCSRSLGEIGGPALPKILELLKSNDGELKAAGQNALAFFDDSSATDQLVKIRADNSGWMANNKKLQIARAVGVALLKIQSQTANPQTRE